MSAYDDEALEAANNRYRAAASDLSYHSIQMYLAQQEHDEAQRAQRRAFERAQAHKDEV